MRLRARELSKARRGKHCVSALGCLIASAQILSSQLSRSAKPVMASDASRNCPEVPCRLALSSTTTTARPPPCAVMLNTPNFSLKRAVKAPRIFLSRFVRIAEAAPAEMAHIGRKRHFHAGRFRLAHDVFMRLFEAPGQR